MANDDHTLHKTRATYEKIAITYAENNRDRSPLAGHLNRFIELVKPNGWVLDVGCGPGFDTAVFQQHNLQTIALDYTHAMMQAGQTDLGINANFVQGDMRQLPFAPQQFDGIWASASLLHLEQTDVSQTIAHFYHCLRPEGIAYMSVKVGEGAEWTSLSYGQAESRYFTYWQPDTFDQVLQQVGFTIVDGSIDEVKASWLVRFVKKNAA